MIVSVNDIVGSLVYRTRTALNKNSAFLDGVRVYEFSPTVMNDNKLSLWHYPGTQSEISGMFLSLKEVPQFKFPSVFNFQSIKQERGESITVFLNLAIVAPVISEWDTQTRDGKVFKLVLRHIYEEFINQVGSSGYFNIPMHGINHTYHEVFTTGKSYTSIIEINYGDYFDAIEMANLRLQLRNDLCPSDVKMIEEENAKVAEGINNLI